MQLDACTEQARTTLQEARNIVQQHHHTQLDVEHIFLAILNQPDGLAPRAFSRPGVEAATVAQRIEQELDNAPRFPGAASGHGNQVYVTPRTQQLLKRAEAEARTSGDPAIGVDALLLAIAAEPKGTTPHVLHEFNIEQGRLHQAVLDASGRQRVSNPAIDIYAAALPGSRDGSKRWLWIGGIVIFGLVLGVVVVIVMGLAFTGPGPGGP
jgi:ATP-dependent Clp protease ATP-binding subunit ClpC